MKKPFLAGGIAAALLIATPGMALALANSNSGNGALDKNGNNNASLPPSQRNHLLADNGDIRASQMAGTAVFNDRHHTLGTVNDLLIGRNGIWAIVSTNTKKVAVPFRDFGFGDSNVDGHDTLVLPHVTEAELNSRPAFHYHLAAGPGHSGNGGSRFSRNNTGRGYAGDSNGGWLGADGGSVTGGNAGGGYGNGNNG